jgi:hypothetical protein
MTLVLVERREDGYRNGALGSQGGGVRIHVWHITTPQAARLGSITWSHARRRHNNDLARVDDLCSMLKQIKNEIFFAFETQTY